MTNNGTNTDPAGADSARPKSGRPMPAASSVEGKLGRDLEELFAGLAFMVGTTGDLYSAEIIAERAHDLAAAWARLAKKNPRVRMIIESMVHGSAWGEAIMATAAVAIPIAAHHGLIPEGSPMPFTFGMVPPSDEVRAAGDRPTPGGPVPGGPVEPDQD